MIIDARHIGWRRGDKEVLRDITWQVHRGEHWSLLGLNGSGKTTLLKMINGYIWPTTGTLNVLGRRFGTVDLRELRKKIGWVSSALAERLDPRDDPESIVLSGKFATIGLYRTATAAEHAKARRLLEELDGTALIGRPFGILSQGERQSVLIARALMAAPDLLILDEPCNGLDIFARERLLSMISRLASLPDAPTLIFVTHHVDEVMPCFDHTLLLKAGTVHQAGLTDKIMTPENLSAFYGGGVIISRHGARLSLMLHHGVV